MYYKYTLYTYRNKSCGLKKLLILMKSLFQVTYRMASEGWISSNEAACGFSWCKTTWLRSSVHYLRIALNVCQIFKHIHHLD